MESVQHNRYAKKNCSYHREKLCLKTVGSVEKPGPGYEAAEQQHSTGQSRNQSQAHANLFSVCVIGMNIVMKM
jgi:hypothetical protein